VLLHGLQPWFYDNRQFPCASLWGAAMIGGVGNVPAKRPWPIQLFENRMIGFV
jgi:hypothetical protein